MKTHATIQRSLVDRRERQTRDTVERRSLFKVDEMNRLTKQADGTSSTPPDLNSPSCYTWTLNQAGNWKFNNQDDPTILQVRRTNAQNEYDFITGHGVNHDYRGNVIQHGDRKYVYDWDNRLVEVRDFNTNALVYKYAYDGLGRLNCRQKYESGVAGPAEFLHYAGRGLRMAYVTGEALRWFITSPRTG